MVRIFTVVLSGSPNSRLVTLSTRPNRKFRASMTGDSSIVPSTSVLFSCMACFTPPPLPPLTAPTPATLATAPLAEDSSGTVGAAAPKTPGPAALLVPPLVVTAGAAAAPAAAELAVPGAAADEPAAAVGLMTLVN